MDSPGFRGGRGGRVSRGFGHMTRGSRGTSESPPMLSGDSPPNTPGISDQSLVSTHELVTSCKRLNTHGEEEPSKTEKVTKGTSGEKVQLIANYFRVHTNEDWVLHQYKVDFDPEEDETRVRKGILGSQRERFSKYLFDGSKLYTPERLRGEDQHGVVRFVASRRSDHSDINVTIKYISSAKPGDPIYVQFYNIMVRKCLVGLGLEQVGRDYFDVKNTITFPALKLTLYPGYMTSLQQHSTGLLLGVEITHKVLRTECVLDQIKILQANYRGPREKFPDYVNQQFKDTILMTTYNRLTYRFVSVNFQLTPEHKFPKRDGKDVSYLEYYKKYGSEDANITDLKQPMLVALPTKRFVKKGEKKSAGQCITDNVNLVPELCLFTGLTDQMRQNNSLMKELSGHLHMGPMKRAHRINNFMQNIMTNNDLRTELEGWGLNFDTDLIHCPGRILPKEAVNFANGEEMPNEQADFTKALRKYRLFNPSDSLEKWTVIITQKDLPQLDNLIKTMQKVSGPLGFKISQPRTVVIQDPKCQSYVRAVDEIVGTEGHCVQMVFVILATNAAHTYGAVKTRLVVEYGVPSQCFLSKNLTAKGLMSIATKMVVQMCTKLGGEPWTLKFPLKGTMVIGFDSYKEISSMVSNTCPNFTKYFSTISHNIMRSEIAKNFCSDLLKCLNAYKTKNEAYPSRIVVYREGQLDAEAGRDSLEIDMLKAMLGSTYEINGSGPPSLTYVMLSKRTNTRLFLNCGDGKLDNPPPGTVVDDVITLPNKYQFFLISCTARNGTVSPCCYVVIYDDGDLNADRLQKLTYKLCHMYFNWSGTVGVPAHVQYAHKLAQTSSVAYDGKQAHLNLSELLYYL